LIRKNIRRHANPKQMMAARNKTISPKIDPELFLIFYTKECYLNLVIRYLATIDDSDIQLLSIRCIMRIFS